MKIDDSKLTVVVWIVTTVIIAGLGSIIVLYMNRLVKETQSTSNGEVTSTPTPSGSPQSSTLTTVPSGVLDELTQGITPEVPPVDVKESGNIPVTSLTLPPPSTTSSTSNKLVIAAIRKKAIQQLNNGEHQEAIYSLLKVIEYDNNDADAYYLIASCYWKLKKYREAHESYKRCMNSTYSEICKNRANESYRKIK